MSCINFQNEWQDKNKGTISFKTVPFLMNDAL